MKRISLVFILILLGMIIIYCSDKDDNTTNTPPPADFIDKDLYGNATTIIEYYEYDVNTGNDVFIEEKTYQYDVEIFLREPLELESSTETNPFNLSISPDRNKDDDEEGYVDIVSAIIVDDILVGKVFLQYWEIDQNGNNLTGTLTDNHIANLLWAWEEIYPGTIITWPFPIENTASLSGTITSGNMQLTIEGQSTDTYRIFTMDINASLVK